MVRRSSKTYAAFAQVLQKLAHSDMALADAELRPGASQLQNGIARHSVQNGAVVQRRCDQLALA